MRHGIVPFRLLAPALFVLLTTRVSAKDGHDCFVDDPKMHAWHPCQRPLVKDTNCSLVYSSDLTTPLRMDCDIAIITKKPKKATNKWLVVHAGGCDTYTEAIGQYYLETDKTGSFNYFSLQPCAGIVESQCLASHDFSLCKATHMSWLAKKQGVILNQAQGFNPPVLMDAFRNDNKAGFLLLHEYGDSPSDYPWLTTPTCNRDLPAYVCVIGDDNDFHRKWKRMRPLLESSLNSLPNFPCRVHVINSRNSTEVPGSNPVPPYGLYKDKPCSGMYGTWHAQGPQKNWEIEMPGKVTSALNSAIVLAKLRGGKECGALQDFRKAMNIALENGQ